MGLDMTSTENIAETIQIAADFIHDECGKRGTPVSSDVALAIARHLWDIWHRPGGMCRHIPAGDIAQKFRERYELPLTEIGLTITEAPLVTYSENPFMPFPGHGHE